MAAEAGHDGATDGRSEPTVLFIQSRTTHSRSPSAAPDQSYCDADFGRLARETCAFLQRHWPTFDRSRTDDSDAHYRLLLRHPLREKALRGSRASSGLSLVLSARSGGQDSPSTAL